VGFARSGGADRPDAIRDLIGRPSLSHEYLLKALLALIIAISIQFVYIAFRFGWNYIFGLSRSSRWSATPDDDRDLRHRGQARRRRISGRSPDRIGYSVMDTIVILDRIRENTKLMDGEP